MKIKPEDIVKANHFVGGTGGGGGIVPTGTKLITTTELVDVSTFANAKVSDEDLVPENIKQGVNILGVVGEFEGGGISPEGTKLITTTELVDVSSFANAKVSDEDLVPENIKQGVNILGVVGEFEGGGGTEITMTSTISTMSDFAVAVFPSWPNGLEPNSFYVCFWNGLFDGSTPITDQVGYIATWTDAAGIARTTGAGCCRYRSGWATMNNISSNWACAVSIGDKYTLYKMA